MKRLPLPYLLLLPLLAVLLFGNCGLTSTRQVLQKMDPEWRAALRASVVQRQVARDSVRVRLRGESRFDAYEKIEQKANRQADSILIREGGPAQQKFKNRRSKLERQLLQMQPVRPAKSIGEPIGPR